MTDAITLRLEPLTETQAPRLAELILQMYQDDPGEVGMNEARAQRQALEQARLGSAIFPHFLCQGETVVGYVLLVPYYSNEYGGWILFLDEIFVGRAYRGQGLGTVALALVEAFAKGRGFKRIQLETHAPNESARRLYIRQGYEVVHNTLLGKQLEAV